MIELSEPEIYWMESITAAKAMYRRAEYCIKSDCFQYTCYSTWKLFKVVTVPFQLKLMRERVKNGFSGCLFLLKLNFVVINLDQ